MQITSIEDEKGKKPSATFAIVEDHQGFIWFGTIDGLYRFDGFNYKIFRHQQNKANSLSNNTIRDMSVDQSGKIWIATQGGGLNAFDPITETFINYRHTGAVENEIRGNFIWSVLVDHNNDIWAGITGKGVDKIEQSTGKVIHFDFQNIDSKILQQNDIRCLLEDNTGKIWAGIAELGVICIDTNSVISPVYMSNSENKNELIDNLPYDLHLGSDNKIRVAKFGEGVKILNQDGTHYNFLNDTDPESPIINDLTYALAERVPGEFWIATEHGLSIYYSHTNKVKNIEQEGIGKEHISENRLRDLFVDSKGIVWAGTESGVEKFVPQEKFKIYTDFFPKNSGIRSAIVKSITSDKNYFWVGFIDYGLVRYSYKTKTFKHYYAKYDNSKHPIYSINALLYDQWDNLWINDWISGLFKYDYKNDGFIKISDATIEKGRLLDNQVQRILDDTKGLLWIATQSGLNRYDIKKDEFSSYVHDPENTNSLSNNSLQAQAIAFDKDSNLWLGTWSFGLNKMEFTDKERKNANFKHWGNNPNDTSSLPNNNVISLLFDDENLWIGTFGGGLSKMNLKTEHFTTYTIKDGLPNNIIYSIIKDKNGNLWLSTDFGISMFNPVENRFYNYTQEDGLQDNHYFWGSAYKDKNGTIFFGGIKGLNSFIPEKVKPDSTKALPVIVDIKLFNESIEKDRFNSLSDEVKFHYHENFISIEFASLDYSVPKYNQYKYKLEGFDKEWIHSKTNNSTSYTNLPPGNYVFKLQVSNNDGIWNNEPLELKLTIIPPWWQTWLARIIFLVLISTILFFTYRIRINLLQKQKQILEQEVQDRTAELNKVLNEQKIILDNIAIGVAFVKNKRIIWVNNAITEILGYTKDELIGKQPKMLYASQNDFINHNDQIRKQFIKGNRYSDEKKFIKKDKGRIWTNIIGNAVNDRMLDEGAIWLFQDITERKQYEFELKKAKEQAESANRAKSEFLANMSHEIRTPINAILGFSEILQEKIDSNNLKTYTKGIHNGGKNLLRLIDDILDLSKVEAGKLEIQLEPVNLLFLLKEIEEIFILRVREKGLDLSIQIDINIPKVVLLDETRIRQVLFNLVGNAVKFTKTGEIKIELSAKATANNKVDLIFELSDTGIGIPENQLKVIFEPFKQTKGQKTKIYQGTGLGLAISEKLVKMMNGEITVQSAVDSGTTFTVTIPDVEIYASNIEVENFDNGDKMPDIIFEKAQILYAEDIISNREVIRAYLENYEINIVEAENGEEAINMLSKVKIDLILMDIEMPVMNGIEAAKAIRSDENYADIPIVAITASAMHSNKERILKYCNDFLKKPVSKNELITTFAKYLPHQTAKSINKPASQVTQTIFHQFSNKTKVIPDELIDNFRVKFTKLYNEISKTYSMDESEMFAKQLKEFANINGLDILFEYSVSFEKALNNYEFEEIEKLVDLLSDIINN